MKPTVHVLLHGKALCGSIHGEPGRWGEGHRWVSFFGEWRGGWKRWATCEECRCSAERLEQMQQPQA